MSSISKLSETFSYEDTYFNDFDDYIESHLTSHDLVANNEITFYSCRLIKVATLDSQLLLDLIHNHFVDNSSEDGDEWVKVEGLVKELFSKPIIDFNNRCPSLWWPHKEVKIATKDIVEYIKKHNIPHPL